MMIHRRRFAALTLSLVLLALSACDVSVEEPRAGRLSGTVTLLGTAPIDGSNATFAIYTSIGDMDTRQPYRTAPLALSGSGNGRTFTFALDDLPGGTYYATACFTFGCGEYVGSTGQPAGINIFPGGSVSISMQF
jgi:hypothetical protein